MTDNNLFFDRAEDLMDALQACPAERCIPQRSIGPDGVLFKGAASLGPRQQGAESRHFWHNESPVFPVQPPVISAHPIYQFPPYKLA